VNNQKSLDGYRKQVIGEKKTESLRLQTLEAELARIRKDSFSAQQAETKHQHSIEMAEQRTSLNVVGQFAKLNNSTNSKNQEKQVSKREFMEKYQVMMGNTGVMPNFAAAFCGAQARGGMPGMPGMMGMQQQQYPMQQAMMGMFDQQQQQQQMFNYFQQPFLQQQAQYQVQHPLPPQQYQAPPPPQQQYQAPPQQQQQQQYQAFPQQQQQQYQAPPPPPQQQYQAPPQQQQLQGAPLPQQQQQQQELQLAPPPQQELPQAGILESVTNNTAAKE
jgi:hypothetical protein